MVVQSGADSKMLSYLEVYYGIGDYALNQEKNHLILTNAPGDVENLG